MCGNPGDDFARRYWEDCSAAMQNILIAAHAIGVLDGVWLGVRHAEGAKRQFVKSSRFRHIAVLSHSGYWIWKEKEPHKGIDEEDPAS